MNPQAAQNYLKTKVLTATPEQLQLMLFDGAIRFAQQGREALVQKNYEASFKALSQAQKIINQLNCGLKHELYPELCGKLASLYNYAFRQLVLSNTKHSLEGVDEAVKVLQYQRETWVMLMEQLSKAKASVAAQKINIPAPSSRMEASISFQG